MRKVHEEKLIERAVVGDGLWRNVKGMEEDGMYVCMLLPHIIQFHSYTHTLYTPTHPPTYTQTRTSMPSKPFVSASKTHTDMHAGEMQSEQKRKWRTE